MALTGAVAAAVVALAVLGALIVYSRFAKRKNVPKYIYWMTMVAGGFLIMSFL